MRCDIDDARIFLQVIRDRRNPLEVLREGLSNSYDASASRANAIIRIRSRRTVDVEIHDNGLGIRPSEFRYFFGLGFGNKIGLPTIGNKGLGTKLFFNSDGIEVSTKLQSGGTYEATLESPLQTLENGIVPRYNVHPKREVRLPFRHGTSIRIRELRANSQSPLLSIENIANYLRWFTVAGSCRRILGAPEGHRFAVKLIREGSLQEERLVDGHELPGLVDPRTDDYLSFAESFDPFIIELHDDVGATLGRRCRGSPGSFRD